MRYPKRMALMSRKMGLMKMAAMLCIIVSGNIVSGCNVISRRIASGKVDTISCEAFGKIGNPAQVADADSKKGEDRFFSYGIYGYGSEIVIPGIGGQKLNWDQITRNLKYVNDPATGPAEPNSGDANYRITKCGQKWIDWAKLYNKRLCTNLHKAGRSPCEIDMMPERSPIERRVT